MGKPIPTYLVNAKELKPRLVFVSVSVDANIVRETFVVWLKVSNPRRTTISGRWFVVWDQAHVLAYFKV